MSWDKGFGGLTREAAALPLVHALAAARTVPTELTEPGTGASNPLPSYAYPGPIRYLGSTPCWPVSGLTQARWIQSIKGPAQTFDQAVTGYKSS